MRRVGSIVVTASVPKRTGAKAKERITLALIVASVL
jgi:hypothetical protein